MLEPIRRWDAKIAETHARLQAQLSEAVMASEPLIASIQSSLDPLVLPWNTLTPRLREAHEDISGYWNTISDEMSAAGISHDQLREQGSKRDQAICELELLHERMYGSVMARAAERMRQRALASDAANHPCNNCGGPLERVATIAHSLNVECAHCKSINTIHPGDALRLFAACGAMHLANEAARPAYEAMRRLETRIKQFRDAKDVPLTLLIEFEGASRAYWTTRLEEEARYNAADAKYVAAKLDRYMKDVLKTLRRYWQWREYESRPFGS